MISFVRGSVYRLAENSIILDMGNVGYRVHVTTGLLSQLKEKEEVFLWTYQQLKEDAQNLYGFARENEKILFEQLLSVSGIGPKLAMTMISTKSIREIVLAIANERSDVLSEVPGIGAKTAKRLILELKDQMVTYLSTVDPLLVDVSTEMNQSEDMWEDRITEAVMGLESLGYARREVEGLIVKLAQQDESLDASKLITQSLKELAR